ncbi:MAG: tetratricopeptide repeat protein [Elusimicrobia bacterium]|nr:tetratricopeptide repeat protein [Elusimicrobiota bacterium]
MSWKILWPALLALAFAALAPGLSVARIARAEDDLRAARAQTPASPAVEAADLVNAGRFEEAVAKYKGAIAKDPDNPGLHLSLGLACQSLKRYPEAIASIEKAASLNPRSPEPYYSLGLLYEAAGANPAVMNRQSLLKAKRAWSKAAGLEKDPKKLETAKQHLARILELLEAVK